MTEQQTSYDDWARSWLESQQQAWQALLRQGTPAAGLGDPEAAFADWLGGSASLGGDVGARLVAQAQQFLQLAEALGTVLAEPPPATGDAQGWQALLDTTFTRLRTALESADADLPGGTLGGLLDAWQQLTARIDLPAGSAEAPAGPAQAAYLAALQAYGTRLTAIQAEALERLQRELAEQFAAGGRIGSLRQLYDLWVEASEAVYAEHAVTAEFAAGQAGLAHALCRLHQAGQAQATATRDGLLQGAAALRRELERLRDELARAPAAPRSDGDG
ncbi:MAG TPA: poly(R)-hydroxyalkanoic acid synthase subunit PhaE [Gammaproteobacteria bacterium]